MTIEKIQNLSPSSRELHGTAHSHLHAVIMLVAGVPLPSTLRDEGQEVSIADVGDTGSEPGHKNINKFC